jgi:hypothetical protein
MRRPESRSSEIHANGVPDLGIEHPRGGGTERELAYVRAELGVGHDD